MNPKAARVRMIDEIVLEERRDVRAKSARYDVHQGPVNA